MSKLRIFNKLISKAREGGYTGSDYKNEIGFILDGTNIYSLVFREDFARALWGDTISSREINGKDTERWAVILKLLVVTKDKWGFLDKSID